MYPKNDNNFTDGIVTSIAVEGDRMRVGHHMPNWCRGGYDGVEYFPNPLFEVKVGMKIRYYSFMSVGQRGVYIGGRIVVPYADEATHQKRMQEFAAQMLDKPRATKPT